MHVVAGKPSVAIKEGGIYWAPVANAVHLSFEGTDQVTVSKALIKAFGYFPIRLSADKHLILMAMAGAAGVGEKPYLDLAEALGRFGELELTEA